MKVFILETEDTEALIKVIRALSGDNPVAAVNTGSNYRQVWQSAVTAATVAATSDVNVNEVKPDLEVWAEPRSWDGEAPFNPESPRNIGEPTTHQHPLYQDGLNAWYGLLHTWNTNFGVEGEPQPDRAKALMDMLNFGGQAPWVYIRAFPGLTQAIFALVPDWGKKRVRQVTENIVQVASALAYREFADHLEYTVPYINWTRLSDETATS